MDQVFLDTNTLIDIFEKRREINIDVLVRNHLFASPLSIHIYTYLYKYQMPYQALLGGIEKLEIELTPITHQIATLSLIGPTSDFEDNIQLHSAAEAECDYFLTNDEKLLKMKFFGKTQILASLIR